MHKISREFVKVMLQMACTVTPQKTSVEFLAFLNLKARYEQLRYFFCIFVGLV